LPRQARDINLDIKRVVAYRHWCNKLWNAVRFAMLNLGEGFRPPPAAAPGAAPAPAGAPLPCRWVLARLSAAAAAVVGGLTSFEFAAATHVRAPWAPQGPAGAVAGATSAHVPGRDPAVGRRHAAPCPGATRV
jgi:valyl-tRNA synthetase